MDRTDAQRTSPETLCTQCALCCNGTLFADVRLQKSDSTTALESAGVNVWKRRGAQSRFRQPCGCLHQQQCRIYEQRPTQCRAFECRVLLRVKSGDCSRQDALKLIRTMQRRVQRVERLLSRLGQADTHLAITVRYSRIMRMPMDLQEDPKSAELRGRLMLEMHQWMVSVQRDFLG